MQGAHDWLGSQGRIDKLRGVHTHLSSRAPISKAPLSLPHTVKC